MRLLHLIIKEALHRKLNFLFSLLGIVTAMVLFVFLCTALDASRRETARLMRDLGLNLRIIPKDTDMDRFWAAGYSERTMPEDYVQRLASHTALNYTHLLPTLRRKIEWQGREVVLTGTKAEVSPVDRRESPMSLKVDPGSVHVGCQLARDLHLKKGDEIKLAGKTFRIASCLPESGSSQDVSIIGHLGDVQAMTALAGRINEIQALNCVCFDTKRDALEVLREQLAGVLPDTKVIQVRSIAEGREKQRRMIEDYVALAVPFVLIVCAVWVGLLAMINVRQRLAEIGILRALGYSSGPIASLFLGRAVVIGLLGAVIGFPAGTGLAMMYGPRVFAVTGKMIVPLYAVLGWSALAAPLLAAAAAFIPAMAAVLQDPAVTLREDPA